MAKAEDIRFCEMVIPASGEGFPKQDSCALSALTFDPDQMVGEKYLCPKVCLAVKNRKTLAEAIRDLENERIRKEQTGGWIGNDELTVTSPDIIDTPQTEDVDTAK